MVTMVPLAPGTPGSPKNRACSEHLGLGWACATAGTNCLRNPRLEQWIFSSRGMKNLRTPQSSEALESPTATGAESSANPLVANSVKGAATHGAQILSRTFHGIGSICVSVHPNTRWRRPSGNRLRDIKGFFRNIGCALWYYGKSLFFVRQII